MARVLLVVATVSAGAAQAERITEFAPFVYDTGRPGVLVLEGPIGARTGFVFKRALRRFQPIETLELVSGGGNVYDALPLAYDVRDAGLTTFIPQKQGCASACSYLFFAGAERRAEGRLGVHQIDIKGADPQTVQSVLADVFQLFEDFDVPPGVHSKMMATPADGMYWFEPSQMALMGLTTQAPTVGVPQNNGDTDWKFLTQGAQTWQQTRGAQTRQDEQGEVAPNQDDAESILALDLAEMSNALRREYRIDHDRNGVLVTGIREGNKFSGVWKGDTIWKVGEFEVDKIAEVEAHVRDRKLVVLHIIRPNGFEMSFAVVR